MLWSLDFGFWSNLDFGCWIFVTEARMKPRKNHTFSNVVFSFVTSSIAPHIGDIETRIRMGKPRETTLSKTLVFRLLLPPLPPT